MSVNTKLKEAAFERDDYECRNCGKEGDKEELQPHHIVPKAMGGNDCLSNLATLCETCHGNAHATRSITKSELVKEGIEKRKEEDDYHHGPAPLGMAKNDGLLVEGENYHEVVSALEMVRKEELSKRKAAQRLDSSRASINRALERTELYGL